MPPSLWLRLTSSGPKSPDKLALARYFRDEGLHAELDSLRNQDGGAIPMDHERMLYAARSYFAA